MINKYLEISKKIRLVLPPKLIKQFYDFYAYREFSNSIDKLTDGKTDDEEIYLIKKNFSNRLLIVFSGSS